MEPIILKAIIGTIGLLTSIFTLIGVYKKAKKAKIKKENETLALFKEISKTNELLVKSLENNGNLLKELNNNFMLVNERVLVDDENSANIMKTSIWNDFGNKWMNVMFNIYLQNHLEDTEKTLRKIQGSTYTLLKSTLEKSYTITGFRNYLPELSDVLDILNNEKIYNKTLTLMLNCKETRDICHLKDELYSLYQVTYSIIDKFG